MHASAALAALVGLATASSVYGAGIVDNLGLFTKLTVSPVPPCPLVLGDDANRAAPRPCGGRVREARARVFAATGRFASCKATQRAWERRTERCANTARATGDKQGGGGGAAQGVPRVKLDPTDRSLSLSHVAQSLAATHYSGEYKVQNVATGEYLHFSR